MFPMNERIHIKIQTCTEEKYYQKRFELGTFIHTSNKNVTFTGLYRKIFQLHHHKKQAHRCMNTGTIASI